MASSEVTNDHTHARVDCIQARFAQHLRLHFPPRIPIKKEKFLIQEALRYTKEGLPKNGLHKITTKHGEGGGRSMYEDYIERSIKAGYSPTALGTAAELMIEEAFLTGRS